MNKTDDKKDQVEISDSRMKKEMETYTIDSAKAAIKQGKNENYPEFIVNRMEKQYKGSWICISWQAGTGGGMSIKFVPETKITFDYHGYTFLVFQVSED